MYARYGRSNSGETRVPENYDKADVPTGSGNTLKPDHKQSGQRIRMQVRRRVRPAISSAAGHPDGMHELLKIRRPELCPARSPATGSAGLA